MYTDLLDAHFYIFARWTLDVLEKYEKQIASIKGEFIPFLVKLQFRKKLKKGNAHRRYI
jgi:translation initiation factor eIF-2B subunit gamma